MTNPKELLEKRVKEFFGSGASVDIEYRVWIPRANKDYNLEFQLLEEFETLLIDFYYVFKEKP